MLTAAILSSAIAASAVSASGGLPAPGDVVWGVKTQGGFAFPPTHLYAFAPDGSNFQDFGPVTLEGAATVLDGLSIDASGTLRAFTLETAGSRLVAINPADGGSTATPVGPNLRGRAIRAAVINGAGELIAIDYDNVELLVIDPSTGAIIGDPEPLFFGCDPAELSSGGDIVQGYDGRYLVARGPEFFTLSRATGRLTLTFTDPVLDDGFNVFHAGLAVADAAATNDLFAYEVNANDDIFVYDRDNMPDRVELHPNIIAQFNAGRGDLAAIATVPNVEFNLNPLDLDGDEIVGPNDLAILLSQWGPCPGCPADANCDGVVDANDLAILLAGWS